jgi:hypothetical protein
MNNLDILKENNYRPNYSPSFGNISIYGKNYLFIKLISVDKIDTFERLYGKEKFKELIQEEYEFNKLFSNPSYPKQTKKDLEDLIKNTYDYKEIISNNLLGTDYIFILLDENDKIVYAGSKYFLVVISIFY